MEGSEQAGRRWGMTVSQLKTWHELRFSARHIRAAGTSTSDAAGSLQVHLRQPHMAAVPHMLQIRVLGRAYLLHGSPSLLVGVCIRVL